MKTIYITLLLLLPVVHYAQKTEEAELIMNFSNAYLESSDRMMESEGMLTFSRNYITLMTSDHLESYRVDSVHRSFSEIIFFTSQFDEDQMRYDGLNKFTFTIEDYGVMFWTDVDKQLYLQLIISKNWTCSFPYIRRYRYIH